MENEAQRKRAEQPGISLAEAPKLNARLLTRGNTYIFEFLLIFLFCLISFLQPGTKVILLSEYRGFPHRDTVTLLTEILPGILREGGGGGRGLTSDP